TYPWTRYNQGWREEEKPNCTLQQINSCDQQLNEFHEQGNPYMGPVRWSISEYQDLEKWNLYNAYRRDMTIMVLDIVSLWPTYDPILYPTSFGVKSELTREIYTDIRGTTYRSDASQNTLDAIEGRMIQPPKLFSWLRDVTFHLKWIDGSGGSDDWTSGHIATGLQSTVQKTLAGPEVLPLVGTTGTYTTTLNPLDYAEGITHINTQQWFEPRWFEFYSGGYNTELRFRNGFGTIEEKQPFWAEGPLNRVYRPTGRTSQIPDHRLSWITYEPVRENAPYVWPQYKQLGAIALGWTHNSVDPTNTIVSDKITSIPAVKAYSLEGGAKVVKGPGSTGGDLIQLPASQGKININLTSKASQQSYRVRIRYAATAAGRLQFRRIDQYGVIHSTNTEYVATGAGPNASSLTYNQFQYVEIDPTESSNIYGGIILINEMGGPIYIDKIEFIPLTPTTTPP
ncbi:delta endotoxin C-terminal domain-containing protein, partial [Bacillus mycoides]|uniref:delta endotoxin C-terminal domain-containing protein n=1 Tax=Bacillus mycoides TaxID=1405 RepID=UPI003D6540F2